MSCRILGIIVFILNCNASEKPPLKSGLRTEMHSLTWPAGAGSDALDDAKYRDSFNDSLAMCGKMPCYPYAIALCRLHPRCSSSVKLPLVRFSSLASVSTSWWRAELRARLTPSNKPSAPPPLPFEAVRVSVWGNGRLPAPWNKWERRNGTR